MVEKVRGSWSYSMLYRVETYRGFSMVVYAA